MSLNLTVFSQRSKLISLYKPLVHKSWKAEGNWGDGSKFQQEIKYEFSLDSNVVFVETIGYIDEERTKLGVRNRGIRKWDESLQSIRFWEFDVFGGLTEGVVKTDERSIYYEYEYGDQKPKLIVTDAWIPVTCNSYHFIVGIRKYGKWEQKFLETKFE